MSNFPLIFSVIETLTFVNVIRICISFFCVLCFCISSYIFSFSIGPFFALFWTSDFLDALCSSFYFVFCILYFVFRVLILYLEFYFVFWVLIFYFVFRVLFLYCKFLFCILYFVFWVLMLYCSGASFVLGLSGIHCAPAARRQFSRHVKYLISI